MWLRCDPDPCRPAKELAVTTPAEPTRSRHVVPALLIGIVTTLVISVGGAIWLSSDGGANAVHAAAAEAVPEPVLTALLPNGPRMTLPWNAPLTVSVRDDSLKTINVLNPDGDELE